jgi:phage shock protein PspC (stress-responsive transcriptional regulator)
MLDTVSGTQRQQTHPLAGAEDTLKDFWTSRPRRPRRGRKIAGVAAAIANRYAIDPVIVRVTLVVAAFFGGAGLMLYLFGWLFFPEENDEEAPFMAMVGNSRSSTGVMFTTLLCMAMIGVSIFTFAGDGAGLIGIVLLIAAVYLLHRHRAALGRPEVPVQPQTVAPQPTMPLMGADVTMPVNEPESRSGPPAWDPLGAAPFAWDLPDPAPAKVEQEPPVRRNRSRAGAFTLGAALAIGGVLVLFAPSAPWLTPGHVVGILLAVIGLGMVGGSFVGGGRGLIGLAVPLTLAGFVLANSGSGPNYDGGVAVTERWGSVTTRPASISLVEPSYSVGGGTIDLDFTALPDGGVVHTQANVGLGNLTVLVPATADVEYTCAAELGSVECLGQEQNSADVLVSSVDNGTDGPGGLKIYLDARVGSGTVEVRRG